MEEKNNLQEVDKILYHQLELLAEYSQKIKNIEDLIELTKAMTEISKHFRQF
jgi:hypothetical protein